MTEAIKPSSDNAALVDHGYFWRPITKATPRGVKLQLVNEQYGVACYGKLGSKEHYFTHWAPLPKFPRGFSPE
jgi:hypothetical protein